MPAQIGDLTAAFTGGVLSGAIVFPQVQALGGRPDYSGSARPLRRGRSR